MRIWELIHQTSTTVIFKTPFGFITKIGGLYYPHTEEHTIQEAGHTNKMLALKWLIDNTPDLTLYYYINNGNIQFSNDIDEDVDILGTASLMQLNGVYDRYIQNTEEPTVSDIFTDNGISYLVTEVYKYN